SERTVDMARGFERSQVVDMSRTPSTLPSGPAARRDGADPAVTGAPATYTVDVPGGTLVITERPDGEIEMTGAAVIVAEGEIAADWLESVAG
ncbi:hypothetical protein ABZ651_31625, partial [Streptomyces sp. NPDC007070]